MAGDVIKCSPNAMMMIHDPWGMSVGTADDMRKCAGTLDQIRDTLLDTYVARTKGDRDEISAMMAAETWFKAEDAKKNGFVDEIEESITEEPTDMAFALLSKFKNAPKPLVEKARETNNLIAKMGIRIAKNLSGASPAK